MDRQRLLADVEWKAGVNPGELEGYASVFGNVDQVGDIVLPGAFRKTIADWKTAAQPMPLIADHDMSTGGVIGSISHMREDNVGLKFRAGFSSTQKAQDVRTNILEGHLKGTSFTYLPIRSTPGRKNGKSVRYLEEVRVFEITVSPFPVNELAGITAAKAVVDRPWDGDAVRFTPEQYRRSCLIDTGEGDVDSKGRYKLPVREPNGDLNRNALGPAAAALAGARGGVQASPEQKRRAARALIRLYGEADMDPPENIRRLAGSSSALDPEWLESLRKALDINFEWARKAAVDELVAVYQTEPEDVVADPVDEPVTTPDAATEGKAGTSDPAVYALSIANPEPQDAALTGEPPDALPGPLAELERDRSNRQLDSLEAEMARGMARAIGEETPS